MPFYNIENVTQRKGQGSNVNHVVIGELMKGGWVITQGKKDPSPHFHPNEEQYMLILEGKIKMVLGDEMKILESGIQALKYKKQHILTLVMKKSFLKH